MIHHISGTLTRTANLTRIANNQFGIQTTYQGSVAENHQGSFFLYPILDERTKTVSYFAFDTAEQYSTFTKLLKISGVGGKIAYTLAMLDKKILTDASDSMDPKLLQAIPGVGPKLATKLLVELSHNTDLKRLKDTTANPLRKKVLSQLANLGYDKTLIEKTLTSYPQILTDETLHDCFVWCIHQM